MRAQSLLLTLISLVAASAAHGETYRIDLPAGASEALGPSVAPATVTSHPLEVGMTSWAPMGLTLPGRISADASLQPTWLPPVYLNKTLFSTPVSGLSVKAGLNWAMLERRGMVGVDGVPIEQVQSVHLFSLRAGLEYATEALSSKLFAPFLTASLLPTLAVTERSSFDEGAAYGGVPLEGGIGTLIRGKAFDRDLSAIDLLVGLVGTAGNIAGSNASGWGVNGGLRVNL